MYRLAFEIKYSTLTLGGFFCGFLITEKIRKCGFSELRRSQTFRIVVTRISVVFFLSFFFLRLFVLFNLQRASSGMKRASVQVWIFSRCNFGFLGVAKRALPGFSVSSRSCESFLFLFFISVAARIDPSSRPALSIRAWNTSSWSEKKKRAVWGFYWNLIGSRSLWRPRRWWWWTSFDQEEERTHIQKKKKIK